MLQRCKKSLNTQNKLGAINTPRRQTRLTIVILTGARTKGKVDTLSRLLFHAVVRNPRLLPFPKVSITLLIHGYSTNQKTGGLKLGF